MLSARDASSAADHADPAREPVLQDAVQRLRRKLRKWEDAFTAKYGTAPAAADVNRYPEVGEWRLL
jgi:hypothetical protein